MLRFERSFNGFESVGTAYDFMEMCAKAYRVELAQTAAEIGVMPNRSEVLSFYAENNSTPASSKVYRSTERYRLIPISAAYTVHSSISEFPQHCPEIYPPPSRYPPE